MTLAESIAKQELNKLGNENEDLSLDEIEFINYSYQQYSPYSASFTDALFEAFKVEFRKKLSDSDIGPKETPAYIVDQVGNKEKLTTAVSMFLI